MLRIILLFCSFLLLQNSLKAQHYRTAAGIRLGDPKTIGLTIQQKIYKKLTLEGILQVAGGRDAQSSVILLAEQHQKILFKHLNLYYGLGVHKSWYSDTSPSEEDFRHPSGISAITGLELAIARMTVSLDIQPNLNIFGGSEFLSTTTGVSLRYIIIKPKKKKRRRINWKFWENS